MNQKDWISLIIPTVVSVLGFYITYRLLIKEIQIELSKKRKAIHIDRISDMPYDIIKTFDDCLLQTKDNEKWKDLLLSMENYGRTIFAFGSQTACLLMSDLYKELLKAVPGIISDKVGVLFILLFLQLKYDATEILINPEIWYTARMPEYLKSKENLKDLNNKIVKDYSLNNKFAIE